MYCEQVLISGTLEMTQGRYMCFKQAHLKLTGVLVMKINNRNHLVFLNVLMGSLSCKNFAYRYNGMFAELKSSVK